MTAIIISLLAALGIGGGVMLASSGGSGSSGGAAVVAPVNPGGAGGGSNTGGSNTGGSNTGGSNTGGSTGGSTGGNTGGGNNTQPSLSNLIAMGKNAPINISVNNQTLTMTIQPLAPTLDPQGDGSTEFITNIEKGKLSSQYNYVSGFGATNPVLQESFNLNQISSTKDNTDFYNLPTRTQLLPRLKYTYFYYSFGYNTNNLVLDLTDVTWTLNTTFALGGRNLGLKNSNFGYYSWSSIYTNYTIEHGLVTDTHIESSSSLKKRTKRYGAQQFYTFDRNKQVLGNEYAGRYGTTARFTGNVIGAYTYMLASCWNSMPSTTFAGSITLDFNFSNNTLTGSVASSKANLNLTGKIQTGANNTPNFVINDIGNSNATPQNNATNYGGGVFVKGTNSPDEVVGEISYAFATIDSGTYTQANYINLAFGATKQ